MSKVTKFLASLFAFTLLFTFTERVHADTKPNEGYVYLGKMLDDGKIDASTLDRIPVLKVSAEKAEEVTFNKPVTARLVRGTKLRDGHSPTAAVLGRLTTGSSVRLLSVYVNFGYAWGKLDTSNAAVLSRTMSPALDGFTGRSGFGPNRTGRVLLARLDLQR